MDLLDIATRVADKLGRPSWDDYYLAQAWLISRRSLDPRTKHGCILVSKENRPLSQGFNGPLRGVNDTDIPLTSPDKYYHLLHAEENALLSYNGSFQDISGGTSYQTGMPCHNCLRMMIQKGLKRIVCGHLSSVMIQSDLREQAATELMLHVSGIELVRHPYHARVRKVLEDTITYFNEKLNV